MEFSLVDTVRRGVEIASNGRNTVMYDEYGNPCMMMRVNAFTIDEIAYDVHPAFMLDDNTQVEEFWVSKYPCIIGAGGAACSIPRALPSRVTFDQAKAACKKKGKGWHLMTNLEWSAVATAATVRNVFPGESKWDGVASTTIAAFPRTAEGEWLTGGGVSGGGMNHDGTPAGLCDFAGTLPEHVDGIYVTKERRRYIYSHGNGEVVQNRIKDDKYYWTGMCFDITRDDKNIIGGIALDNDDDVSQTADGSKYYSSLYGITNSTDDMVPDFNSKIAVPHNLWAFSNNYKLKSKTPYVQLTCVTDANAKVRPLRGFNSIGQEPTALDIDFGSINGTALAGFRAVYTEY